MASLFAACLLLGACEQPEPTPQPADPGRRVSMTVRWRRELRVSVSARPTVAGEIAYVADARGTLHALDLADGSPRWTYQAYVKPAGQPEPRYRRDIGFEATPVIADGRVFVGDDDGTLHVVDMLTGEKAWTYPTGARIRGPVTVAEGRTLLTNDEGLVICLDADGGKQWEFQDEESIYGGVAMDGGSVVSAGCGGKVHAIDLADGQVRAAIGLIGVTVGTPLTMTGRAVVSPINGQVECFDLAAKSRMWLYELEAGGGQSHASPILVGDVIVVGGPDNAVHGIDAATGRRRWRFPAGGELRGRPGVLGETVFVGCGDGKLYALDPATGEELGQFSAGRSLAAGVAAVDGLAVVVDAGGVVYCLDLGD